MKISVITSFNKKYYDLIGKTSIESFLNYWPNDIDLTCYVEEFNLPFSNSRITEISFNNLSSEYFDFQKDIRFKPRVKTFAKKAYSIIHAFENNKSDFLIWLDADVITLKSIPFSLINNLCDSSALLSYMRVWHNKNKNDECSEKVPSAESGFFIVNMKHPEFKNFSNRYREYYDKKITANLRRFYDGEVLGAVAKEFEGKCKIIDWCESLEKQYNSPLKHLPIGEYIIHHKSKHSKDQFEET